MDGTKFKRMMAVFEEVADLPPERRPDLIRDRCAGDPELRVAVVAMLAEAGRPDAAMKTGQGVAELARGVEEHPSSPTLAIERAVEPIPVLSGHFRILRIIGEGGMGTVYEAEQRMPRRIVALKAIRRGMATPGMMRRFQQEAQILARLQHPGIAHLYEVGVADEHDAGQAFIAMELVHGRPLNEHTVERALQLPAKLELMAQVCDAVHHAHQRGVIHRDLKPSNILVDETGQPKILDFGVARATDAMPMGGVGGVGGSDSLQTGAGQLIGTLPYMSPEQVAAEPDGVDVRTDVYALGVLLYELLAGRPPLDLRNRPIHEAARMIREEEPARLGKLDPKLRGDVEIIVVRALEKDKARRYQSAAELRDELRRCIRGEAIHARRDSAIYVLRKQMWRHRVAVGAVSGVVIGVSAFGIHSSIQADSQRLLAQQERDAKLAAVVAQGVAEREHNRANREAAALRDTLYFSRIGFADSAYSGGDAERMRRVLQECPPDQRDWEWRYLARLADQSTRSVQCFEPGHMMLSMNPGLETIYAWRADGRVAALRASDGARVSEFDTGRALTSFAQSSDGRLIASGDGQGRIIVQNADDGKVRASWSTGSVSVRTLQFAPQNASLLAATQGTGAAIWDPLTGELRQRLTPADEFTSFAAYSPDGQTVAAGRPDWTITLLSALGDEVGALRGHEAKVQRGVFSADGALFVSGAEDRTTRVWDVASGSELSVARGHANKVLAVDLSPDGRLAVSGGTEGVLRVTDARTGKELLRLLGHESSVTGVCFTSDGAGLVSSSRDGAIRWWSMLDEGQPPTLQTDVGPVRALSFEPAGRVLLFGGETGAGLCAWPLPARAGSLAPDASRPAALTVAFAPDGDSFEAGPAGEIIRRHAGAGEPTAKLVGHTAGVLALACSPDGRTLASGSEDWSVRLWDLASDAQPRVLTGHQSAVAALAWNDGELYSGSSDGTIRVWDAQACRQTRMVQAAKPRPGAIMAMCVVRRAGCPTLIVSGGEDGEATAWDAASLSRVARLRGHKGPVNCLAATPDGARVASGGFDNTVRLWDPRSGAELLTLRAHLWSVRAVAFTPDGSTLVSGASDETLRFWHTRARE